MCRVGRRAGVQGHPGGSSLGLLQPGRKSGGQPGRPGMLSKDQGRNSQVEEETQPGPGPCWTELTSQTDS